MDDAGKITTAFTDYGNCAYADRAASFIMNNAINSSGFLYLPQRTVNESFSRLHINSTQLASSSYQSEFNPLQNVYFENPPPNGWNTNATGFGHSLYEQGADIALEGNQSAFTSTGGAGSASFYQAFPSNSMSVFAHATPLSTPSNGDGILGNLTGNYNSVSKIVSGPGTSSVPFTFLFDSYPTMQTDLLIPANNEFNFSAWLNANQSLTGVTLTAQVNETCNNYSTKSTPWSTGAQTVNLTTTSQQFNVQVPTGSSQAIVSAGCALRFILTISPNTTHEYTFTVGYDSGQQDTHVDVPFSSTINLVNSASTQFDSMSLLIWPISNDMQTSGFYVALITSAGTELLTNGTVTLADIPNLVYPVHYTNMGLGVDSQKYTFYTVQENETTLFSTLSGSSPDAVLKYCEFGTTSTNDNATAGWDSIHVWLSPPMLSNTPNPTSGQYLPGGYWYGTNGNIDFTNSSVFAKAQIYEQSDVVGVATADENDTMAPYFGAPNLLSQSPLVNSLIPYDTYSNATGYNMRDELPYNYAISQPIYRLYASGGNGSDINLDMLVAADGYQNVYVWLNATTIPGADYYLLTEQMVNYGSSNLFVQDLALGIGALSPFSSYNPWLIWTQFPNGTFNEGAFYQDCPCSGGDANATSVPPGQNEVIWNAAPGNGGATPPTAMLVTGINTGIPAENTNGLFLKILNSTRLEEIRFEPTIFGHSIRLGMVMNSTDGAGGIVLKPGQASPKFMFEATPIIRTMHTEPRVLFNAFQAALTKPGLDVSMPATWGYDSYGLALLGQAQHNQTILNFDKELWNSEWQDASQRYNGFYDKYTNQILPTHVYYRSLNTFALAGLELYPNNSTVFNIAQSIAQNDILGLQNPYGLGVSQEEYGAAADLLAQLYPSSSSSL